MPQHGFPDNPFAAPLTPVQLDQARTWVGLSWIRLAADIATTVLVLLAVFARTDK